jgi:hypothetical protein
MFKLYENTFVGRKEYFFKIINYRILDKKRLIMKFFGVFVMLMYFVDGATLC